MEHLINILLLNQFLDQFQNHLQSQLLDELLNQLLVLYEHPDLPQNHLIEEFFNQLLFLYLPDQHQNHLTNQLLLKQLLGKPLNQLLCHHIGHFLHELHGQLKDQLPEMVPQ